MIDTQHIESDTAQAVRTLIDNPPEPDTKSQEAKEILEYYKNNFDFVQVVHCLSCGSDLCLWVLDRDMVKANLQLHHLGLRRITLGDALWSTRRREDGVMGYMCECGAYSLVSEVEKEVVKPLGPAASNGFIPELEPHMKAAIQRKITATNYKPPVEQIGDLEVIDGFAHRVIKGGVLNA